MLDLSCPLYFPKFSHAGQATFKAWSDSKKKTNLYKLDWSKVEEIKASRFNKWAEKRSPVPKFPGDLPEVYDEWLKKFTFAIPNHYMDRINDFSQQAHLGWSARYPRSARCRRSGV